MLFACVTGNEGKQCFPFSFWREKQAESIIVYTNTCITEENTSAQTMHVFAKAVHSGQEQSGGED